MTVQRLKFYTEIPPIEAVRASDYDALAARLAEAERLLTDALVRSRRYELVSGFWVEAVEKFLRTADSASVVNVPPDAHGACPKSETGFHARNIADPESCGYCGVHIPLHASETVAAAHSADAVRLPGESQQHANERIAWERHGPRADSADARCDHQGATAIWGTTGAYSFNCPRCGLSMGRTETVAAAHSATHVHTDECWEPDSGCDMGRNEEFAKAVTVAAAPSAEARGCEHCGFPPGKHHERCVTQVER